ncbi:MAG: hypothetical protein ABIC04_05205 [Nanoarchaeota archaeon]
MKDDMMKHKAWGMVVVGLIVILARIYTAWDIWVVIGGILVVKGLLHCCKPMSCCATKTKK